MTAPPMAAPPTSAAELFAVSAEVARELAGAEHSAWNGQVYETTGTILGLAHWDGSLYLDRECIVEPLERMYEHAGEEQPGPTLVSYRESLGTLLHEQAHFLGPLDASQEAACKAFTEPGTRQLEEGVTEAWTQDHLDEYIRRLGIDQVAPGIESVDAGGYYPAFVPAVRRITAELESRSGLAHGELVDVLNRRTASDQVALLTTVVYNASNLPALEPPEGDTRTRLEAVIRDHLARLDHYEQSPPGHAAARSHLTAGLLLEALDHEIRVVESALLTHPTACELPAPAARLTPSPLHPPLHTPIHSPLHTPLAGTSRPRTARSTTAATARAGRVR
ncbi:hypothetical protein AB0E69_32155 [Kribbella sp. NPDC026611]|uniref:hypothetical protein n=1 Tax=Kribbella sp. NPDC026611 TaxID=3154911 RepID=UPI0033F4A258